MTDLRQAVDDYLRLRRSLGHQMAEAAYLLPDFVSFMDHRGEQTVTVAAALDWMKTREPEVITTVSPRRITAVRGFARYLSGIDPATEVPPLGLVPYNRRRGQIFLYSDADIAAIMAAAEEAIPQPLRAVTYHTLIGLLAAAGLRIGEAIKLDRDDIDWTEAVLHIRESKFGKSRLVPLQDSATNALREYDQLREDLMPRPKDPAFFVSLTGKRLLYACVHPVFRDLVDTAGVGVDARTDLDCTSCDTPSPSGPCCTGIAPRPTSRRGSRRYRPTWDTANRPAPTGTCRQPRNCSPWPPLAATASGRRPAHDADRPHAPGVLHRTARPPAPG
ncbi:tyrosine-type recombinase/integrase [Streptomyces mirabilis]|uniref:tyrosine-type recombinase/integrase n=1 Tax=Streptomyces mirabilis TaxID=68239 RepID=UPI0033A9668C